MPTFQGSLEIGIAVTPMGLTNFVENHIIGQSGSYETWTMEEWLIVFGRFMVLAIYLLLHFSTTLALIFLKWASNSLTIRRLHLLLNRVLTHIPYFGDYKIKLLRHSGDYMLNTVLPKMERLLGAIEVLFQVHLSEMVLKNNNAVEIFVNDNSNELRLQKDGKLLTTLILSNHRSIMDYTLINYLINAQLGNNKLTKKSILEAFWNDELIEYPKIRFISWGKMVNFPKLAFLFNILTKDENSHVSDHLLAQHLKTEGNQVLVIFPEVNTMSAELGIVQRKLNEGYPFAASYHNLLYPRFKNYTNAIKCIAGMKRIKRPRDYKLLSDTKQMVNIQAEKILTKMVTRASDISDSYAHIESNESMKDFSLYLDPANYDRKEFIRKTPKKLMESEVTFNSDLYDITIIYYKVKAAEESHDHITGNLSVGKRIYLEQVAPAVLQLLKPSKKDKQDVADPIVIKLDIKAKPLDPILRWRTKRIEKSLEDIWKEKDTLINVMDKEIKLK